MTLKHIIFCDGPDCKMSVDAEEGLGGNGWVQVAEVQHPMMQTMNREPFNFTFCSAICTVRKLIEKFNLEIGVP